jgi:Ca2+/Na+ antiporter
LLFGTSAPEASIGIISALNHANALTLGDVIGSSVANMHLLVVYQQ